MNSGLTLEEEDDDDEVEEIKREDDDLKFNFSEYEANLESNESIAREEKLLGKQFYERGSWRKYRLDAIHTKKIGCDPLERISDQEWKVGCDPQHGIQDPISRILDAIQRMKNGKKTPAVCDWQHDFLRIFPMSNSEGLKSKAEFPKIILLI